MDGMKLYDCVDRAFDTIGDVMMWAGFIGCIVMGVIALVAWVGR